MCLPSTEGTMSVEDVEKRDKYKHVEPGSYYDELVRDDIIGKLQPLFESNRLVIDTDGRIVERNSSGRFLAWNSPWIHRNILGDRNCDLWHLTYQLLNFVPTQCRNCWKVVVTPLTLKQLFRLERYQFVSSRNCKCGIELRAYTRKFYGGYWYNDTRELGEECFAKVKADMMMIGLGDCPIILKRYCTEFEREFGGTKNYKKPDDQDHWEKLIRSHVLYGATPTSGQPEFLKRHIRRRWIEFAWRHGDETVYEYTGGKDIYAPLDTYHEGIESQMGDLEAQIKNVQAGVQPDGEVTPVKKPVKPRKKSAARRKRSVK